jgi:hypothetical protein
MRCKAPFAYILMLLVLTSVLAKAAEITGTAVAPSTLTLTQNTNGTFDAEITSISGSVPKNAHASPSISYCSSWAIHSDGTVSCSATSNFLLTPGRNYTTSPLSSAIAGTVSVSVDPGTPCTAPNNVYTINEVFTSNAGSGVDFSGDSLTVTQVVTVTVTCNNATPQGCSHGFWKNHAQVWPSAYSSDPEIGSVFTMGPAYAAISNKKFSEALAFTGGPSLVDMAGILMRDAVAAVLNASDPTINYPIGTPAGVISDVNTALANGAAAATVTAGRNILEAQKNILSAYNEGSCPYSTE